LEEVKILDNQVKAIKFETFKLSWFMRGGMTLDEAFSLGYEEREVLTKLIEEHLETTKSTQLPFF